MTILLFLLTLIACGLIIIASVMALEAWECGRWSGKVVVIATLAVAGGLVWIVLGALA